MNFENQLKRYQDYYSESLNYFLLKLKRRAPKGLYESISYSLLSGGKRIRPVLCYATAEMLGLDISCVKDLALAIEMIHTYSLVHDDLPAMDNDDYRRGQLSTHKKFGEANGILTGDALLNLAFEVCLDKESFNKHEIKAIKIIAEYAGVSGMIAGQFYDLTENKPLTEEFLYNIYENKTAKLIMAPILAASCFANEKFFNELKDFAYNLGVLFQITDDFLDLEGTFDEIGKTPNKDRAGDKLTAIDVFGFDGAKAKEREHYFACKKILNSISVGCFLSDFTDEIYKRKK